MSFNLKDRIQLAKNKHLEKFLILKFLKITIIKIIVLFTFSLKWKNNLHYGPVFKSISIKTYFSSS